MRRTASSQAAAAPTAAGGGLRDRRQAAAQRATEAVDEVEDEDGTRTTMEMEMEMRDLSSTSPSRKRSRGGLAHAQRHLRTREVDLEEGRVIEEQEEDEEQQHRRHQEDDHHGTVPRRVSSSLARQRSHRSHADGDENDEDNGDDRPQHHHRRHLAPPPPSSPLHHHHNRHHHEQQHGPPKSSKSPRSPARARRHRRPSTMVAGESQDASVAGGAGSPKPLRKNNVYDLLDSSSSSSSGVSIGNVNVVDGTLKMDKDGRHQNASSASHHVQNHCEDGKATTTTTSTPMSLDAENPFPWLKKSSTQGRLYNPKAPPPEASSPRMSKTRRVRSSLFDKFTILSYLKVLILCIPPCYWPFGWPRLRQRKRLRRTAVVDYLDYEESTNEKRNNKTAAKKFIIDHDLQGFADMQYMPEARNGVIRLIYLITINSLGCGKRPYTRSQQDIFEISTKADWWTMMCLNLAMIFVPIFGLASLFAALTFIKSLNEDSVILLPAGLSALFGFISGALGVVSTGTNPHFASVAANEKQNVLAELENEYATLAIDLLEMYDSQDRATRDFARRIARGLKIGIIQELLSKHTEWGITEPLREAKRFILHKNVCFHSTVIRTYLTKDHRHQMKRRKALSKAENYFKKLNIPIPDDDCMSSEMMDIPSEDTATEFEEDEERYSPFLNSNTSNNNNNEPGEELQRTQGSNHRRKDSDIVVNVSPPVGDEIV